jgi:hypothetical protein
MGDAVEFGNDDPDRGETGRCAGLGGLGVKDGSLKDDGTGPGSGAPQRAPVRVTAAAAGRFYMSAELLWLPAPVMKEDVGPGQGSPRTEEHRQQQERREPALNSTPCRPTGLPIAPRLRGATARSRVGCW